MIRFKAGIFFLFLCSACGKNHFPDYSGYEPPFQFEVQKGIYKITFRPLNHSRIKANGLAWIKGNQFYVKINASHLRASNRYLQYFHKGSRCPSEEDDENKDGVIDREEVLSASGRMLLPLDGKLNTREEGNDWFPQTNQKGEYFYSRSSVLNSMLEDLYSDDSEESLGKLEKGEDLDVQKRVIIIYGSVSDPLYPVACGKLSYDDSDDF